MSYEENIMVGPSSTANIAELSNTSEVPSTNSNMESPYIPIHRNGILNESVAILWDIENCPVPSYVRPEDVSGNILMALRVHPIIKGAVTMFSAYGDFNAFPRRLREGCQRTGVKLVDVPNGRKDAADKAILIDMFLFALDNRPPSSIMLISGDVDFSPALHILGQRGYTIILVIPSSVGVSSALSNAGRFVWDWPSVARGEGVVPPRTFGPRGNDLGGYLMSYNIGDNLDGQNEEEVVYKGTSQSILTSGSFFASSRTQSLPSALSEATGDHGTTEGHDWWVMPGDIQGLKGQLARLLEMSGGSMPLVHLPPEYLKLYGRPLYMAEYGVHKLVHLIGRMRDAFVVSGQGHKKLLCLRNPTGRHVEKFPNTPPMLKNDKKGKEVLLENMHIGTYRSTGSSLDDSDEEKAAYDFDDRLGSFRMDLQELLVCFSGQIQLGSFEAIYEQRYNKSLNYQSFGVDGLEELLEKVPDVVELREDQGNRGKFLFSSCVGGESRWS